MRPAGTLANRRDKLCARPASFACSSRLTGVFMAEPIAVWHAEHVRFGQLLDLLEKQVAVFHGGERVNYELMRDILYYLRHFPDRFHHPSGP